VSTPGANDDSTGEGSDLRTLALPGDQDWPIDAVARVNRRTVAVLNTGGPVLMPWLHRVAGVVEAVPGPGGRQRVRRAAEAAGRLPEGGAAGPARAPW